jgi:hypothetical protein
LVAAVAGAAHGGQLVGSGHHGQAGGVALLGQSFGQGSSVLVEPFAGEGDQGVVGQARAFVADGLFPGLALGQDRKKWPILDVETVLDRWAGQQTFNYS